MRRLSPLRRAFWLGYRAGLNKAQAKMRSKVDQWEAEIDELEANYEMLISELRCARDEQAVQEAVTERAMYPDAVLN